ncbi:molybdopterin binding protein [Fischerella sp. NIES-4106]|jgi:molybdopterin-binding protein|nr:molybdopterin binding protein [Fischerella sp. NIES-4106]
MSNIIESNRSRYKKMKISARNTLKATVKKVVPGSVNTEVILELAPGVEVTAIITKASADNLQLAEGKESYVVVKATDVMVAVD